jgi:hypothetical protein
MVMKVKNAFGTNNCSRKVISLLSDIKAITQKVMYPV